MLTPEQVHDLVEAHSEYLQFNKMLLDIYDDNIGKYVIDDLEKQLSPQAFQQAKKRLSPINILPKVIDKLTNIFQTPVTREVLEGNNTDKEIFDFYSSLMRVNEKMDMSNELLNLCKSTLIYPTVNENVPELQIIENDKFIVYAANPMMPHVITHVIILAGTHGGVNIYWVWEKDKFYIVDSDRKLRRDIMAMFENEDGVNPIGRLPFVYCSSSPRQLMPKQDRDMIDIVKLIPTMMTDLNLAAMFQCFSIIYTVDVKQKDLKFSPNAVWDLKSNPESEKSPQIGAIKPNVDYDQVMNIIETQLSLWLGTKGIKASTMGGLDKDNFASGISKMIDQMDTFEARQKQITKYTQVEKEMWDLILNYMHPYWSKNKMVSQTGIFSSNAFISTSFKVPLPPQTRGEVVKDVRDEYAARFTTKIRALKKINPEMTEKQIEELNQEIEDEFPAVEVDDGFQEVEDGSTED